MKFSIIIRFVLLGILWLALCYWMLKGQQRITLYHLFVVFVSGVIIFVPMYKKYVGNGRK